MSCSNSPNGIHHRGCECWEAERNEKLKIAVDALEPAAKYLESCGYDKAEPSEPEFQMLKSFREALAKLGAAQKEGGK